MTVSARQMFVDYNKREYIPHMSLVYGDFIEEKKQQIISELGNVKAEFIADKIYVYDTSGKPDEWEKIKEYKLTQK